MNQQREFKLNLPGLLQVLAEHLYSDRRVGVRELLQNAHDSCSRRQIEFPAETYRPRIDLRVDPNSFTLEVEDNGSGLTEDEIDEYLTTIGRGYTRHLREAEVFDSTSGLDQLIGQFGLGFLSAFLLAEKVELDTLSCRSGAVPIRWFSVGDGSFETKPGDRQHVGTRIRLVCKPAMRHVLNPGTLADLVRQYGDLLPHPIYVNDASEPANRGRAPWGEQDFRAEMLDFLGSHGLSEPLWMVPLRDWDLELNLDSIRVPLAGALLIPNRSVASLNEFGDATVYIRNMFICRNQKSLLPRWARFVRAIVSSPMLQPTASRESIHEDEGFEAVAKALEQQILEALDDVSTNQPDTWAAIVRAHTDLIIGWATSNDQFFAKLVDRIELETNRGRTTIGECLAGGKTLYYCKESSPTSAERLMQEALGQPVVDASWFGVQPFLTKYQSVHRDVEFVECDRSLAGLIQRESTPRFDELIRQIEALGIPESIVPAVFQPHQLAAVVTYPAEAEVLGQARSALDDEGFIPGISDVIPDWIQEKENSIPDLNGTLFLNTGSRLIQHLNHLAVEQRLPQSPLVLLLEMTRLLCRRQPGTNHGEELLESMNRALLELVPK